MVNVTEQPRFLRWPIVQTVHAVTDDEGKIIGARDEDGNPTDLLTGGMGLAWLKANATTLTKPAFADPLHPSDAELRRNAILTSHFSLIDLTEGGGYGRFYGPEASNDGQIWGVEYVTYAEGAGTGPEGVVTVMLQIPASFNPSGASGNPRTRKAALIAAPSSGSRGVYGAVATVGEWALKQGCAVVYTDKGTGIGAHDLQRNLAFGITGQCQGAEAPHFFSPPVSFKADLTATERAAFTERYPHRFAFKHAHSRRNPEQFWGLEVLRAIRVAFFMLNRHFRLAGDGALSPANTWVIGSSVSNGGASSLRAAEQDADGLIHAVVVSEPAIQPVFEPSFQIRQGDRPAVQRHSVPLLDYISLINLFQPCASLDETVADNPFAKLSGNAERCAALHDLGVLKADDLPGQAREARQLINDYGIPEEANWIQPQHDAANIPLGICVSYANAYGRFGVEENLCGYSFAAVADIATGEPEPLAEEDLVALFANHGGVPVGGPPGDIFVIDNDAEKASQTLLRPSTPDGDLKGALRLRSVITGVDPVSGEPVTGKLQSQHAVIAEGMAAVRATGNLHGKPAIIVHGRADALVIATHTSRAYLGRNQTIEGAARSRLRYYEVLNAQHLDSFNNTAGSKTVGFDERYLSLHYYLNQALDIMWAHLTEGTELPPSQVVRTAPRGPGAPPVEAANLPAIAPAPPPEDTIVLDGGILSIPA